MDAPLLSNSGEITCLALEPPLNPADVYSLPNGAIAILHAGSAEISPGVYIYQTDTGDLEPIALLPKDLAHMSWSEDGSAFVVFDVEDKARFLGWIERKRLENVSARLEGATMLRWEHKRLGQ
jgi:hypothetical protein